MEVPIYGDVNHIQLEGKIFQIRSLDYGVKKSYVIMYAGEVCCYLYLTDEGKWEASEYITEEQLTAILWWIKKLYS